MTISRSVLLGLLVSVIVGACGSDSSHVGGSGTELTVDGVATSTGILTPNPNTPAPPIPEPGKATEVSISGTLKCRERRSTGTGMFAADAIAVCLEAVNRRAVFEEIGAADSEVCAQVYGGPQHASIKGSIAGQSVNVKVTRTDGCGIADWQRLEWLLGPPER